MKATEAKKLMVEARKADLSRFYQKIEFAARGGYTGTSISLSGINPNQVDEIIKSLKADGYSVKRDSCSDPRESWDNLDIWWDAVCERL